MKKTFQVLPLIFLTPLLMANAPGPNDYNHSYSSYSLSYVSHEQKGDKYHYTYSVQNTGYGYIDTMSLSKKVDETTYYGSYLQSSTSDVFFEPLIGPASEQKVVFTFYSEVLEPNSIKSSVAAYTPVRGPLAPERIQGVTFNRTLVYTEETTLYSYKVELDQNFNKHAIIHFKYDENDCYVYSSCAEEIKPLKNKVAFLFLYIRYNEGETLLYFQIQRSLLICYRLRTSQKSTKLKVAQTLKP